MDKYGREHRFTYCPSSKYHWQKMLLEPALRLTALKKDHPSVLGLGIDLEFYTGAYTDGNWRTSYCHCDECFSSFVRKKGLTPRAEETPYKQRTQWLHDKGFYDDFIRHTEQRVVDVVADVRDKVHQEDPDFVFAAMLYILNVYSDSILRGMGTDNVPAISLTEFPYYNDYTLAIPALEEKFMREKIPAVHVPGMWFFMHKNTQGVDAYVYRYATNSSGYWIYIGAEAGGPSFKEIMLNKPYQDMKGMEFNPTEWFNAFRRANSVLDKHIADPKGFVPPKGMRVDRILFAKNISPGNHGRIPAKLRQTIHPPRPRISQTEQAHSTGRPAR